MNARKVIHLKQEAAKAEAKIPVEIAASPLFGVAMLKIAMELKKSDGADLDQILQGVLEKMRLPEAEFRAFLAQNGGLLRQVATRRKY